MDNNCSDLHRKLEQGFEYKFKEQDIRLTKLEHACILRGERLDNLIEKIDGLTSRINWLMGGIIIGLASFFIWYVQTI